MDMVRPSMLAIKAGEGVSVDCEEVLLARDPRDTLRPPSRFGLGGIGGGGGEIEHRESSSFVLSNKLLFAGDAIGLCLGGEAKVWEEP